MNRAHEKHLQIHNLYRKSQRWLNKLTQMDFFFQKKMSPLDIVVTKCLYMRFKLWYTGSLAIILGSTEKA